MDGEVKVNRVEDAPSALPATIDERSHHMPPALALWFDERLFNRVTQIAGSLSKAEGIVPKHLIGKPQTCFFVVEQALTWKLSPSYVARNCYETPNGQLGYHGQLCQAVLEVSGKLIGGVMFEHIGDWSKVQGKYQLKTNERGRQYPVGAYTEKDEDGLGVIVRAQVKGEAHPRELTMMLRQCFPRNSTLWATDPKTQICYTAVRRFAAVAAPGLFAGIPFDFEGGMGAGMIDVTPPRPERPAEDEASMGGEAVAPTHGRTASADAASPTQPKKAAAVEFHLTDLDGEVVAHAKAAAAATAFENEMALAAQRGGDALDGLWESNGLLLAELREHGRESTANSLAKTYAEHKQAIEQAAAEARKKTEPKAKPAEGEKAAQVSNTPPAEPKAATDGVVAWTFQHPDYKKIPSRPKPFGDGNVVAFFPWLCDQLRDMPTDQIGDFLSEKNYGREFDYFAEKLPEDYGEIKKLLAAKGVKL